MSHTFGFLKYLLRWVSLAALVGLMAGTASAALLLALEFATRVREAHLWLIGLLPLAGFGVGLLYEHFGQAVERGNDLILDEVHAELAETQRTIPVRMAPLVFAGTFLTHLFGGSAGREGTAIQMGASLADQLARPFRLDASGRRLLLMAGISAGFGSVFGTPLAGAVFGMEVLAIEVVTVQAVLPCLLAAFAGDLTTRAWRVHHTVYAVVDVPHISVKGVVAAVLAGVVFGVVAIGFVRATHWMSRAFRKRFQYAPLRPLFGGIVIALAVVAAGSTQYIGLGIAGIQGAFTGRVEPWDWAAKLAFTVVTLAAGFKGGEVTPLFFIGATLGNALSSLLPLPPSLLAGMGFVAVFAGAANTPITSTVMAVELFGGEAGAYAGIACVVSYICSGNIGIYRNRRGGTLRALRGRARRQD